MSLRIWMVAALLAALGTVAGGRVSIPRSAPIAVSAYTSTGPFLDWANDARQPLPPDRRYDATGLPMVHMGSPPRWTYNPVTIAQFGLAHFSAGDVHGAAVAGDWLVGHQAADGAWYYDFDFTIAGMDVTLFAPWDSAMAQGQAISLLTRLAHATGDRRFLGGAVAALQPLEDSARSGGLTDDLFGHPFYEEYPTTPPSHVLNGLMFTLLGLYDLSLAAPDTDAGRLYAQGLDTLDFALPLYDTGTVSAYHLGYLTALRSVVASPYYHRIHVQLLHALDSISPRRNFAHYERAWAASA